MPPKPMNDELMNEVKFLNSLTGEQCKFVDWLISERVAQARKDERQKLIPVLDSRIISRIGNDELRNELRQELIKALEGQE